MLRLIGTERAGHVWLKSDFNGSKWPDVIKDEKASKPEMRRQEKRGEAPSHPR